MRFYYVKGKQHLDMSGNLVLTTNAAIVSAPAKSAAPVTHKARYICLRGLSFRNKLRATFCVIGFIWSAK